MGRCRAGDDIGARTAVGLAEKESITAGWPGHAVLGMGGVIRSRAGIPGDVSLLHQAVVDARAARAGADHIDCSLYLAAARHVTESGMRRQPCWPARSHRAR
jgi:hypothetical protein